MNKTAMAVSPISMPTLSVLSYVIYIAVGYVAGVAGLILLGRNFAGGGWYYVANLIVYAGTVFAHFRFAQGVEAWPRLELNDLGRTLLWAVPSIFIGYVVICYAGAIWYQDVQGLDDAMHLRPEETIRSLSRRIDHTAAVMISVFDACIVAPVAEEVVFRSGLYRIFKGKMSIVSAAVVSALVFALIHRSVSAFLPLWVLGLGCCWVYEKTADIRGPIIFHAGYNLLVFYVSRQ